MKTKQMQSQLAVRNETIALVKTEHGYLELIKQSNEVEYAYVNEFLVPTPVPGEGITYPAIHISLLEQTQALHTGSDK